MAQDSTLIASFEKNGMEEVRFSLTDYKGKQLFDIRVFYRDEDEMRPSKKGICLSRGLFPEFKKAVLALEKALGKENQ
jgi:hypothetical protein